MNAVAVRPAAPPRARRGRPTLAEAQTIDRRIVDAAGIVIFDQGYDGATMDAIAERAGVTKVTIYARYADKAALLRAVLEERMVAWSIEAAQDDWTRGDTLEERLRCYAVKLMQWSRAPDIHAFAALIAKVRSNDAAVAEEINRLMREPMLSLITREIAEYSAREGFAPRAPRNVALMFFGVVWGFLNLAGPELLASEAAVAAYAEQAVTVLMAGRAHW